jgi:hypothetical protein
MNQFPPSPRVSHYDRFKFFRKFPQVKVHHQYQRHRRPICHRYHQHRWQILPPFLLVLLIPWQICHRCQRHWWQIMATISGCRHLKVNLKAKIYIYVISTTQRCPNKIIQIFLIADFFHLPLVSKTPVVHLEPRISPQIFDKI